MIRTQRHFWISWIVWGLPGVAFGASARLTNGALIVSIDDRSGVYTIAEAPRESPVIVRAEVAAEIDHRWVKGSQYPRHEVVESDFTDALGSGRQATVTSSGLGGKPDLVYTIRLYEDRTFGELRLQLRNRSDQAYTVQSLRPLQATGKEILSLGGTPASDRVLSDSFSEDWPPLQIYDLGKAPHGMHRAVGSQLVFNRETRQSVFFGALTADRLLTIFHLQTQTAAPGGPAVTGFTVDSTGTTEIQATDEESDLRHGPRDNLIELSLALPAGGSLDAERLMFAAGAQYHTLLETYGAAIRQLHHSRIPAENMLGWWSWTAFYTKVTDRAALKNADVLAGTLKPFGYDWLHIDLGYSYARGDYAIPNLEQFPHGMQPLTERVKRFGLRLGVWTAPFEVSERSSVYKEHRDWLVHNAKGEPIQVTTAEEHPGERVFVLDPTHPQAQRHLEATYRTLTHDWGVSYIKLDFMDNTAIEGYYFRPGTTALEAQRIGLQLIRRVVGDQVLLDKDGSPMLTPVGLVDDGRISQDTGHTFERSKEAAPAIAARYYMHRNFFINDPDAFTVSRQVVEERTIRAPLSLDEAEVSIVLAAVSGGLFEIGDNLPDLVKDADRLALVENPTLLRMVKLGHAAVPLDLLSYGAEDELPSVFLLRDLPGEAIVAVFNWTDKPRVRRLSFADLQLPANGKYELRDALRAGVPVAAVAEGLELKLAARSVRLIRILDSERQQSADASK